MKDKIDFVIPWVDGGDRLLGNGASIPVQYAGMQYLKDNETNIHCTRKGGEK